MLNVGSLMTPCKYAFPPGKPLLTSQPHLCSHPLSPRWTRPCSKETSLQVGVHGTWFPQPPPTDNHVVGRASCTGVPGGGVQRALNAFHVTCPWALCHLISLNAPCAVLLVQITRQGNVMTTQGVCGHWAWPLWAGT